MATQTSVPQPQVPPPQTQAITVRQNKEKIVSIISGKQFKEQLVAALMSRLEPDFVIRAAVAQLNTNVELQECTPVSVAFSTLLLAQAGLAPEPWKGHGWLIPRNIKVKKGDREWYEKRCTALIGYRVYVYLAYRTGVVGLASAQAVYEGDVFELDLGSGLAPHHEPWIRSLPDRPRRGEFLGAYALVKLKESGEFLVRWMTNEDIDKIRARSSASKKGPWDTDYTEMGKKTAFRALAKWIPDGDLQAIAALDEAADLGKVEAVIDGDSGQIVTVVHDEPEPQPQPIQQPQRLQNGTAAAPKAEPPLQQSQDAAAVPSGEPQEPVRERTIDRSVSQENEKPDPYSKDTNPHGKHISDGQFKRMMAILHSAQKMGKKGVPTDEEFLAKVRELGYRDPRFIEHTNRALYDELCAWADSGSLMIENRTPGTNGDNDESW